MRKSLLICVLLYSICTLVSAQSVRTRPVLQTTEQPEVSRYDTTTMYLSLRKLKKDIHYYDGQTIMYLPDINPNKPYAYYDMFFMKDTVDVINCADTIWNKSGKKIKEIVIPKSDVYNACYVSKDSPKKARRIALTVNCPSYITQEGFYTPDKYIEGKKFQIVSVDRVNESIFEFTLIDELGEHVYNRVYYYDSYPGMYDERFPSMFMCAYFDKYYDKYYGNKFYVSVKNRIEKSLSTNKATVLYGEYDCVDVCLMKDSYSEPLYHSITYRSDYDVCYLAPYVILRDEKGEEFAIATSDNQDSYRYYKGDEGDIVGKRMDIMKSFCWLDLDEVELASNYYSRIEKEKAEAEARDIAYQRYLDTERKKKEEAQRIARIKEEERRQKEQEAQKERFDNLKEKYGTSIATMIINRQVKIGMTKAMCREAWGNPYDINRTQNVYGTHEQWVYGGNRYLYFDGDILTTIQD